MKIFLDLLRAALILGCGFFSYKYYLLKQDYEDFRQEVMFVRFQEKTRADSERACFKTFGYGVVSRGRIECLENVERNFDQHCNLMRYAVRPTSP